MEQIREIRISAGRPYSVLIGRGLLDRTGEQVKQICSRAGRAFVVSDDQVAGFYLDRVLASLQAAGLEAVSFIFEHGEARKTVDTWRDMLESLCSRQFTRSDVLIALGGGVVGDLGGFAAACYQRGIDYIQIPTTLLAMVDSSVGGKTAVDLTGGKNQAGAFYQPAGVLCDPDVLATLPEKEIQCGCAEIIKYGMICSADFLDSITRTPILRQVEEVIAACVEMKRDFVQADEFDRGSRMLLNFGHTFGHACEACSHFSILHGQGVAIGMAMMARAACSLGCLAAEDRDALIRLIQQYGLPTEPEWSAREMARACMNDKKAEGASLRIIVPEKIGRCRIQTIPSDQVLTWLHLGGAV